MEPTAQLTEQIEDVLRNAADAHHLYEVELGGPHEDWAPWYAEHMAKSLVADGYRLAKVTQG